MLAYLDHLEARDELDLEAATEFLVLIAALLELKSRLMLPGEERRGARRARARRGGRASCSSACSSYARFRGAAGWLGERKLGAEGLLYRAAPLPDELRRLSVERAEASYDPAVLGAALGGLLRTPPPVDLSHMAVPRVTARRARWRTCARCCARAAGASPSTRRCEGADRVTVAVTLFALLELYKRGEASWEQDEPFGPITVAAT